MNSRAAWEEEQMFLKALEASKANSANGNGSRSTKRGRDMSEESNQDLKRRKTRSQSDSPSRSDRESNAAGSDTEESKKTSSSSKRSKGPAMPSRQDKEPRMNDKEREKERIEAAGRRKVRADRRHAEETEAAAVAEVTIAADVEEAPKAAQAKPPLPKPAKMTAPKPLPAPVPLVAKKNVRPRRGRVGRNQYTRDRDMGGVKESPPQSRDSDEAGLLGADGHGQVLANGSKPARPRHINPNRTSMNELRKRAAGILEFITRTQVEMAGQQTPPEGRSTPVPSDTWRGQNGSMSGASKLSHEIIGNDDLADESAKEKAGHIKDEGAEAGVDHGSFKAMNSLQMMDVLTRELMLWQRQHGKWGERLRE